jgi:serine/threonine-protein kinase RsbW
VSETPASNDPAPEVDEYGGIPGQGLVRTARIAWTPDAGAEARRVVITDLAAREVPESIVDEVELVLSELIANSLRHASPLPDGTIRVHWKSKGDVVEIEVTDGGGPTLPSVRRPAPWAPSGRGLRIVRSIAHEWGVVDDRGTVTVWAAIGGPSRRRVN